MRILRKDNRSIRVEERRNKRTGRGNLHIQERVRNSLRIVGWTTFGLLVIGLAFLMLDNFGLIERWFGVTLLP